MPNDTEANGVDRLVHILDLNDLGMEDVPREARSRVKEEVADFLEEEILRDIASGTSPVQGEGRFKRLDQDYARNEKGGNRTSNLELEGDLLTDFFVKKTRGNKIKIGHEGSEVPKSDGHNQLSTKAKEWASKNGFPRRRYIPAEGQKFKRRIVDGIKGIIDANTVTTSRRDSDTEEFEVPITPDEVVTGQTDNILENQSVSLEGALSDESIEAFFNNALRRLNRG